MIRSMSLITALSLFFTGWIFPCFANNSIDDQLPPGSQQKSRAIETVHLMKGVHPYILFEYEEENFPPQYVLLVGARSGQIESSSRLKVISLITQAPLTRYKAVFTAATSVLTLVGLYQFDRRVISPGGPPNLFAPHHSFLKKLLTALSLIPLSLMPSVGDSQIAKWETPNFWMAGLPAWETQNIQVKKSISMIRKELVKANDESAQPGSRPSFVGIVQENLIDLTADLLIHQNGFRIIDQAGDIW